MNRSSEMIILFLFDWSEWLKHIYLTGAVFISRINSTTELIYFLSIKK